MRCLAAVESELLAGYLRRQGTPVRVLLTPLVTHAELDRETPPEDVLGLLAFWGAVLAR